MAGVKEIKLPRSHSPRPPRHKIGAKNGPAEGLLNKNDHFALKNANRNLASSTNGNPEAPPAPSAAKTNIVMNFLSRFSKFTTNAGSSTVASKSASTRVLSNNNNSQFGSHTSNGPIGDKASARARAGPKERAKLDQELGRLHNKIENLLEKLDDVRPIPAQNHEEECVVCKTNRATMQTFPCGHQVSCRTCFVKTIQATVAQKKLPLRCIWCSAKILRLQQNQESKVARQQRALLHQADPGTIGPQQLSNSSSNFSFASGVSAVSSASSGSLRSQRSFNFDTLSNFQSVKLMNGSQISRTRSANSFRSRRVRSPSPGRISNVPSNSARVRSQSLEARFPNRTPSEDSLNSRVSFPNGSIASSTSPRSPTSPSWSTGSSKSYEGNLINNCHPYYGTSVLAGSFFPSAIMTVPNMGPTTNGNSSGSSNENSVSSTCSSTRSSRLGTPLSPIKESRQETSGSPLENQSPEKRQGRYRLPPKAEMEIDDLEDERNERFVAEDHHSPPYKASQDLLTPKKSSRIRCADKILRQLENHTNAELYSSEPPTKPGSPWIKRNQEVSSSPWSARRNSHSDFKNANLRINPLNHHSPSNWPPRICRPPSWEEDLELICPVQSNPSTNLDNHSNNNTIMISPEEDGLSIRLKNRSRRAKSVTFSDEC